ncbi:MAG TPA: hypothetical protein VFQ37_11540 [Mycobacterium sp.]|nr:hypothetical protein [Mycobacterium sp.]
MQHALRPRITAGVALTGAGIVAVTPIAAPTPLFDVEHRSVQFTGDAAFPLVSWDELVANSSPNWDALQPLLSSKFFDAPGVADGWQAVFHDLLTGTSNPVTNPVTLLTEAAMLLISPSYGLTGAVAAIGGVWNDVQVAFQNGDSTTAWADLGKAPSTILNALLNGGPSQFGWLTGPDGTTPLATGTLYAFGMLQKTVADTLAWAGGVHSMTDPLTVGSGNLGISLQLGDILNNAGINIPSEISFTIPTEELGGQTVNIPLNLPSEIAFTIPKGVVGGQTVDIPLNLPSSISYTIPTETVGGNTISIPTGFPADISYTLPQECVFGHCIGGNTVSIPTNFPSTISYTLPEHTFGGQTVDIPLNLPSTISYTIPETAIGGQTVEIPLNLPNDINYTIPTFDFGGNTVDIPVPFHLPTSVDIPVQLGDLLNGAPVPEYVDDLAKDLIHIVGSIFPHIGSLDLTVPDPTVEVTPLLSDLLGSLGLPFTLNGDVSVDLTNVVAELLNNLM